MKLTTARIKIWLILLVFFFTSCKKQNTDNSLNVRIKSDPESLNPVTFRSKTTRQIFDLVYQSLFEVTLPDGKLQPVLANKIPEISSSDSGYFATISIREEARWTDDKKVTSNDVAFSIKLLNLPGGEKMGITNATYFIKKITINDESHITLQFEGNSPDEFVKFNDFYIYPETVLDPKNVLKKYSLDSLRSGILTNDLADFGDNISAINFLENPDKIVGSNAYNLGSWLPSQRLILERKPNFWFKDLQIPYLQANPKKITFDIIPNDYSALIALENNRLDVLDNISPEDFSKLKSNKTLEEQFNFFSAGTYGVTFLALNARNKYLNDQNFRKGLSFLVPYDEIIRVALSGSGEGTIGFIPPHQQEYYHKNIQPRIFNKDSASIYFHKAGFRLEDGKLKKRGNEVTFELLYNPALKEHETSALLIQDSFAQAGIDVQPTSVDKNLIRQKLHNFEYDMCVYSLFGGPFSFNYEYILHSSFTPPKGLNFTSFGNEHSDSLIYAINESADLERRKKLLFEFQELVFEECNIIFLYNERNNIAISSRFENLKISALKPGYNLAAFKLNNR